MLRQSRPHRRSEERLSFSVIRSRAGRRIDFVEAGETVEVASVWLVESTDP